MSFDINYFNRLSKEKKYEEILMWTKGFFKSEKDSLANISNSLSLLFSAFGEINWCGFYYLRDGELVLGHFQGAPACTRIQIGKGVCGTSAEKMETIVVEDVHQFPGHIACDARSQSEIVLPLIQNGKLLGVLDIDSPIKNRFEKEEQEFMKSFLEILTENLDFSKII